VPFKFTDHVPAVVDTEPLPHRTTKVLHKMPLVFVGMAATMGGIHWVIKRRMQNMASPKSESVEAPETPENESNNDEPSA
jgi:hypothetical protein